MRPGSCSPTSIEYSWLKGIDLANFQLPPLVSERYRPPSLPRYTRPGTFGSQAIACWSACALPVATFHVCAPSVDSMRSTPGTHTCLGSLGSVQMRPNHHPYTYCERTRFGSGGEGTK